MMFIECLRLGCGTVPPCPEDRRPPTAFKALVFAQIAYKTIVSAAGAIRSDVSCPDGVEAWAKVHAYAAFTVYTARTPTRVGRRFPFPSFIEQEFQMTIQIGDRIPEANVQRIRDGFETIDTHALFDGRKLLLFAVPGAFTPTCSEKHLPGFVEQFEKFREKGVTVACMSVNDAFVMKAWGASQQAPEGLEMIADGNGEFTRALGLELDASAYGMGLRSKRFALYAENGVVKQLEVEAPGEFRVSSAEHMLTKLG
jgi:glutaredoxin/glutathione-dependent peroxiredoxin